MSRTLPRVHEHRRLASPAVTPQALAWHAGSLWLGSRDAPRVYGIDAETWSVFEERDTPGIPWAAVSACDTLRFTIGEGTDDDRYVHTFRPGAGFVSGDRIPCPDFTGSYLSHDGSHLYLSQWYKHRILQLDDRGGIVRTIDVGAEISGHVFVDGLIYVVRGTEQDGEKWRLARLDPRQERPQVEDLAIVPFASRSLTYDGARFWSNHRAANETVSFTLPDAA